MNRFRYSRPRKWAWNVGLEVRECVCVCVLTFVPIVSTGSLYLWGYKFNIELCARTLERVVGVFDKYQTNHQ